MYKSSMKMIQKPFPLSLITLQELCVLMASDSHDYKFPSPWPMAKFSNDGIFMSLTPQAKIFNDVIVKSSGLYDFTNPLFLNFFFFLPFSKVCFSFDILYKVVNGMFVLHKLPIISLGSLQLCSNNNNK